MNYNEMRKILDLCERRGFFRATCSLYGGVAGAFDFGPAGVELKLNIKRAWWRSMVHQRPEVDGLDASILTKRKLVSYSGFMDAGYEDFSLFRVHAGSPESMEELYLRAATAPHAYANFAAIRDVSRRQLPFGIAQIGKAFRNEEEVTDFPFRMREFEQLELQYFVPPGEDSAWHDFWIEERLAWWERQGIRRANIRVDNVPADELAHYSVKTVDLNYRFPGGWYGEIEGIANRADYDCGSHTSGQEALNIKAKVRVNRESLDEMTAVDPTSSAKVVPFVIEPAAGVDRGLLAIICECYLCDQTAAPEREVLRLPYHLAPFKVAVVAATPNEVDQEAARNVWRRIQALDVGPAALEDHTSIDDLYLKHDEMGTPLCVAVKAALDQTSSPELIVRDRDSRETWNWSAIELLNESLKRFRPTCEDLFLFKADSEMSKSQVRREQVF